MGDITQKEKRLLVKLVILVIAIYGIVWGSEVYVVDFSSDELKSNGELKQVEEDYRSRLAQIQDEELLQGQYVESYLSYQNSGLIVGSDLEEGSKLAEVLDEERRLLLLERLQQIQQDRKLFNVTTRLTKPTNLPPSFSDLTADSEVAVRTNTMTVTMSMLHSLDMLMLLNDFYNEETNAFVPVNCSMQRIGSIDDNVSETLLQVNEKVMGTCDLVWLTVFDPLQGKASGAGEVQEGA